MPELPEVETIVRRLSQVLPGQTLGKVTVYHSKSFWGPAGKLSGLKIIDVSRRGKMIRLHLDRELNLLIHLKMTGQLIYVEGQTRLGGGHPTADWIRQLPSQHTRVECQLGSGGRLFFNDQRIFGWVKLLDDQQIKQEWQKLGPDVIDPELTVNYLWGRAKHRSIPVKQLLLDNQIIAGLGNIYVGEALNLAQISPFVPVSQLNLQQWIRLLAACRQVINRGIELGGTTFDGHYVNASGLAGEYQNQTLVYGRQGQNCYQCGGQIAKKKLAGRGTYYCLKCQV